jgi:NTP pyrophosphatase (non-canonical NTP hydrolase)
MEDLILKYRQFVKERNWEIFHNPKNLAAALSVEASELLEIFMWLSDTQSLHPNPTRLKHIRDEMGDVLLYLIRLADVLKIDLLEATREKFAKVEEKYPLDKSLALSKALLES